MSEYISNFTNKSDIINSYSAPTDALDEAIIYLAWYGRDSYDGKSLVIFEKDDTLYEVNGSHCSCMGLEGQWQPEETSWESLQSRTIDSSEANDLLQILVKANL